MAMDFISGPITTPTITTTATTPCTPDSDTDTPPHPPPAKRAHHHNHQQGKQQHVSYKECLKNHAASIGGHALDGCCEFMPGPTANPFDPTSLTCAACGCHRNFHRRDPDDPTPLHHLIPPSVARKAHSPPSASHLLLSLSGHAHSPSGPSDHEILQNPTAESGGGGGGAGVMMGYYKHNGSSGGGGQNGNFSLQSKKRFRTKFSQEQKEKMQEFSEKIGWKLKKGEERLVEDFCKQVGVDRSVFKVWMHNNKHSSSTSASSSQRRDKTSTGITATTATTSTTTATITATSSSNNNNNNNSVGLNNCGGVLTSALDFNFSNAAPQEAKAQ